MNIGSEIRALYAADEARWQALARAHVEASIAAFAALETETEVAPTHVESTNVAWFGRVRVTVGYAPPETWLLVEPDVCAGDLPLRCTFAEAARIIREKVTP